MIREYNMFVFENDKKDDFNFHFGIPLSEAISEISKKEDLVCIKLLNDLKTNNVKKENLVDDPVNYLDVDNDANISFLKSRYFSEPNKYNNNRRVRTRATKIFPMIYKQEYLNEVMKQTDIEAFSNRWTLYFKKTVDVVEFRGDDILRAYNYTQELHPKFAVNSSCANFGQAGFYDNIFGKGYEPKKEWYDIYTKNPENVGVVVVMENDKILGRISFQQGPQYVDSVSYKKDQIYTVYNNFYGAGFSNLAYDYLREKYDGRGIGARQGAFIISLETRFEEYCPFDSMYVEFSKNLLSDRYNNGIPGEWKATYKTKCPPKLVKQRLEEEAEKNT